MQLIFRSEFRQANSPYLQQIKVLSGLFMFFFQIRCCNRGGGCRVVRCLAYVCSFPRYVVVTGVTCATVLSWLFTDSQRARDRFSVYNWGGGCHVVRCLAYFCSFSRYVAVIGEGVSCGALLGLCLFSFQIRCCNWGGGCHVVRCLETLPRHEETCSFVSVPCSSPGCRVMLERYELDRHLSSCEYRTKMCAKGCGLPILHQADNDHSCVAELRLSLDLLRSELISRNEEHQQEMKTMLDAQRHHLAVREATTHIRFEKMAMQLQKLGKEVVSLRQANKQKEMVSLRQANKHKDPRGGGLTETGK